MDTLGPRATGEADSAADGPAALADPVVDVEVGRDRPGQEDDSDVPWPAIGTAVLVLLTGAFATGWHLGRRWGRLMGW